ncbi:Lrp/AsnC family transcriptional regulator [Streptomyces sp. NPDC016469]|uniref:Lrp/AsnC family transcriptional regulator n=1 Tax=Streptomyces sp. NPDC016469 TaxID=3157191 RepID=UPI0034032C9D
MPNIDEINQRLLLELQKNARRSNRELARSVGIADSTCLERVRALQQSEVIRGYSADVDLEALGRGLKAMIAVRIQPKSRDSVESFRAFVLTLAEVLDVFVVSGSNDFQVLVAVEDPQHLEDFVLDHIAQYPAVADLHASLVYEHLRRRPVEILAPRPRRQRPVTPPWS